MSSSAAAAAAAVGKAADSMKCCQKCGFDFDVSWTAHCTHCKRYFNADGYECRNRKIVCSTCKKPPQQVWKDEPAEICKYCLPKYSEELWRFMGCACGNQDPDRFALIKSKWATKSHYCLACQQPYSAFMWNGEMPKLQCPRCNGDQVATDAIAVGEDFIQCGACEGRVSKRRFDQLAREVEQQWTLEGPKQDAGANSIKCGDCGSAKVKLTVTESDGNPCVVQVCRNCRATEFLAGWNRADDCLSLRDAAAAAAASPQFVGGAPPGLEELTRCCPDASLHSLYPVDDDKDDALLMCGHCQSPVDLRACRDRRVPMTVSALRRALKGSYSSGEMGKPYQSVRVKSLADLKPADQLDFKRLMYSHHAIVDKPIPDSDQLQVIEYTGEVNRPTAAAFLRALPTKAHVTKSLLSFGKVAKSMRRIDYHSLDCLHPLAVLQRAESRLNEKNYNLVGSNCEHFSNWAKANVNFSRQVEKFKDVVNGYLRRAVVKITENIDGLPTQGSVGAAVVILQDIRAEMLKTLETKKKFKSLRDFWLPIRLVLKWAIRGLPLALSGLMSKEASCKLMWHLNGLLKPISEVLAYGLLPLEDDTEEEEGEKDQKGGTSG